MKRVKDLMQCGLSQREAEAQANTEAARALLYAENPPADWEDCDQCGGAHPHGYTGDCRNDSMRWPFKAE